MELSKYLRDYSRTVAGKEQLIIAAVAKSLEVIPRQLCDNAGFDSTNVLNRLRQAHGKGEYNIKGLLIGPAAFVDDISMCTFNSTKINNENFGSPKLFISLKRTSWDIKTILQEN